MNGSFKSINFFRNNTLMRWDYIPVASVSKQLTCIWVFYSIDLFYFIYKSSCENNNIKMRIICKWYKRRKKFIYSKTSGAKLIFAQQFFLTVYIVQVLQFQKNIKLKTGFIWLMIITYNPTIKVDRMLCLT